MAGSSAAPSTKPLPPGSFGSIPWLGESLAIVASNHGFYKDRFAKYGPIFKTRLFGINFVVFSGAEGMEAFANSPSIVRGGADPLSVKQIFVGSLALTDGPEHRARKQNMLRAMQHRDALDRFLPGMQRIMESYARRWEKQGTVKMLPELRLLAAAWSSHVYTGDESEEAIRELDAVVHTMRQAFMTPPIPIPGSKYAKALKARARLQELIRAAIARHRTGSYNDALSTMLAGAADMRMPDEKVAGDLLHLLFATQGGYFIPIIMATLALGEHSKVLEAAREEVMRVAPDGQLTMDHMDQLETLERISRETRRFYAMNSATFFGRVTKTIEVGGYQIPAGWGAIGALHITMRSKDVYKNPDNFNPDNFLPDAVAARAEGSYVPHGHGPRSGHKCPAEDMVAVAVKLYLAVLLRRVRWDGLPPQDLTLTDELFPIPASGLDLQFRPVAARAESLPRQAEGLVVR